MRKGLILKLIAAVLSLSEHMLEILQRMAVD
jgi:DNA-binding CsgD family transcriptional regulator